MAIYILVKGEERVEVLPGREARRDRLIAAGYIWINGVDPAKPVPETPPAGSLPKSAGVGKEK